MKNYLVPSVAEAIVAFHPAFGCDFIVYNGQRISSSVLRGIFGQQYLHFLSIENTEPLVVAKGLLLVSLQLGRYLAVTGMAILLQSALQ